MFDIQCIARVYYSAEQMFNIINDINSYKEFIPGCKIIRIIQRTNTEIIAEVNYFNRGIINTMVTHNFFLKNKSIVIFLTKSPFKFFYGCWTFIPITNIICDIKYISFYEFKSSLFENMFNCAFQKIYKNIVTVFISRAQKIYSI